MNFCPSDAHSCPGRLKVAPVPKPRTHRTQETRRDKPRASRLYRTVSLSATDRVREGPGRSAQAPLRCALMKCSSEAPLRARNLHTSHSVRGTRTRGRGGECFIASQQHLFYSLFAQAQAHPIVAPRSASGSLSTALSMLHGSQLGSQHEKAKRSRRVRCTPHRRAQRSQSAMRMAWHTINVLCCYLCIHLQPTAVARMCACRPCACRCTCTCNQSTAPPRPARGRTRA